MSRRMKCVYAGPDFFKKAPPSENNAPSNDLPEAPAGYSVTPEPAGADPAAPVPTASDPEDLGTARPYPANHSIPSGRTVRPSSDDAAVCSGVYAGPVNTDRAPMDMPSKDTPCGLVYAGPARMSSGISMFEAQRMMNAMNAAGVPASDPAGQTSSDGGNDTAREAAEASAGTASTGADDRDAVCPCCGCDHLTGRFCPECGARIFR